MTPPLSVTSIHNKHCIPSSHRMYSSSPWPSESQQISMEMSWFNDFWVDYAPLNPSYEQKYRIKNVNIPVIRYGSNLQTSSNDPIELYVTPNHKINASKHS